jgi:hypothetical protein
MSPFCTHDRSVCVAPIVLPSNRVRTGDTICQAILNKRSHSADIGGTDSRSNAIRDNRGQSFRPFHQ